MLDDLVFCVEQCRDDRSCPGNGCFRLYKTKGLIDLYARFWDRVGAFRARNIVELGIWDGGSVAFWFEYFQPAKYVAIDWAAGEDSEALKQYKMSRGLTDRIKTYWGVDQADRLTIREIVAREFDEPLDLVFDDASHLYTPTKSSFETLFPRLRPSGFYIIEDWAWGHWSPAADPKRPWSVIAARAADAMPTPTSESEIPLTRLAVELLEATGSSWSIAGLTVNQGFIAVERGQMDWPDPDAFTLRNQIVRRREPAKALENGRPTD